MRDENTRSWRRDDARSSRNHHDVKTRNRSSASIAARSVPIFRRAPTPARSAVANLADSTSVGSDSLVHALVFSLVVRDGSG